MFWPGLWAAHQKWGEVLQLSGEAVVAAIEERLMHLLRVYYTPISYIFLSHSVYSTKSTEHSAENGRVQKHEQFEYTGNIS
jgi:hypothetical protein